MQKVINLKQKSKHHNNPDAPNKSDKSFDIMFVNNDDEQSVEVVESSIIDFNRVIEQLRMGNSVFIAPKKHNISQPAHKRKPIKKQKISFITHI